MTTQLATTDDYEDQRSRFDWEQVSEALLGKQSDRVNIAHVAVDRHVEAGHAEHVALRWIPRSGDPIDISYGELAEKTDRFAAALTRLTGGRGTRVASLAGRVPQLYVAALGTLKAGGVYSPLFSAFGPEPIKQRVLLGEIEVLVTTASLYRRKVEPIRDEMPCLRHVVLIDGIGSNDDGLLGFDDWVAATTEEFEPVATKADDLALLHFTSGTTGTPKGAMHVHEAVLAHYATASFALDLGADDVFWCTADPGWVTGTSYGIIAPLTHGVTSIIDEGGFDADRWYSIIEEQRVTVWYTAPTAIRMMMRGGLDAIAEHDLSSLRLVASVGEPLNPEAVLWAEDAFARPVLDNWWQTETGGIMIANYRTSPVKRGSMGRPVPGVTAAIMCRRPDGTVDLKEDGSPIIVIDPNVTGELAIRVGWPSMFRGYLGMDDRYRESFADGWYLSGDLARCDEDGYYWFVGRGDDVIKSAGHLIGPFEVESVLIEHPAVHEAAVIGLPDPTAGEVVKAFVSLSEGHEPTEELMQDLIAFARRRLGPAVAPRSIEAVEELPKTRSGKIMRRLLKARELGLPEGDTSTLETNL